MTSALACSDPPCISLFTQNRKEVCLLCAEAEPQEKAEHLEGGEEKSGPDT